MIEKIYSFSDILDQIQKQVYLITGKELTSQEEEILKGTWNNLSYDAIAQSLYLSDGYIRVIASHLWKTLSQIYGQKITKSQFRYIMINILNSDLSALENNHEEKVQTKGHISIVEDAIESLQLIARFLKKHNYQVSTFINSKNFLLAKKNKCDLILLDIIMPEINGYEICKIIKSNPDTKNIPIIFISSHNDTETKKQCFKLGASDYISKPFDLEELLVRVDYHINCHHKQLELTKELDKYQQI